MCKSVYDAMIERKMDRMEELARNGEGQILDRAGTEDSYVARLQSEDAGFPSSERRFDASQYAFFGRTVTHEIEIGGLEEDFSDDGDGIGHLNAEAEAGSSKCGSELGDASELGFSIAQLGNNATGSETETRFNTNARQRLNGSDAHKASNVALSTSSINPVSQMKHDTLAGQELRTWWAHHRKPDHNGGVGDRAWLSLEPQQRRWLTGIPAALHASPALHQSFSASTGLHISQCPSLLPPQVVLQYHSHPADSPLKPEPIFHSTRQFPHFLVSVNPEDNSHPRDLQTLHGSSRGRGEANVPLKIPERNDWQMLRSKYMTVDEIENIVRIQWAATHSTDPYVDDYYHQAVQTKLSEGSLLGNRHFAPSHVRNFHSHSRGAGEPHAFLQVEALGRVPFSSIHRPRPLLEVDLVLDNGGLAVLGNHTTLDDGNSPCKPLDQEPMLATRIAIEDGFCLLLDVDDIDRLLNGAQPPDGGAHLRHLRQHLLQQLADSLQLRNPASDHDACGTEKGPNASTRNNLQFLRLVSLPKGQKFLTRYMQLLPPECELVQDMAIAVCQHLDLLFGVVQSDSTALATTVGLAKVAAASLISLDLPALSACLAAVVLAPEQPPLRPLGSSLGDGATVVLKALLERATYLLRNRSGTYPFQNRAMWQKSFDAFFNLLIDNCTNKYDGILHSLIVASPGNPGPMRAAASNTMKKEIPVELLRASLPHTNDHQRNVLLEFTQRSFSIGSLSAAGQ